MRSFSHGSCCLAALGLIVLVGLSRAPDCSAQSQRTARRTSGNILGTSPLAEAAGVEASPYGLPGGNLGMLEQPVDESDPNLPTPPQGWFHQFPFIDLHRGNPDDSGRHVGMGEPLEGTSWLNRRWQVGWFFGAMNGDDLIEGHVEQHTGLIGGYRLGYDLNHYWGTEGRFAFSNLQLSDSAGNSRDRTSRDWFWDINLLYYPWGDSRWRPYALVGLGWGEFRFVDHQQQAFKDTTIQIPIGVGMKYYFRNWLALRVDLLDNIAFSSEQVDSMHNLTVTGGVEFRFGGRRKSYYPWSPGIHAW